MGPQLGGELFQLFLAGPKVWGWGKEGRPVGMQEPPRMSTNNAKEIGLRRFASP